jgi:hypothetical protein
MVAAPGTARNSIDGCNRSHTDRFPLSTNSFLTAHRLFHEAKGARDASTSARAAQGPVESPGQDSEAATLAEGKRDETNGLASILTIRRLDREHYRSQVEAAALSVEKGYYATAKAELRGAVVILDKMEKREGRYGETR